MISQAEFQEKMRGRWAVCARGRLGRMLDMHEKGRRRIFVGIGLDGRPWQSFAPHRLSAEDSARIDTLLAADTIGSGP